MLSPGRTDPAHRNGRPGKRRLSEIAPGNERGWALIVIEAPHGRGLTGSAPAIELLLGGLVPGTAFVPVAEPRQFFPIDRGPVHVLCVGKDIVCHVDLRD